MDPCRLIANGILCKMPEPITTDDMLANTRVTTAPLVPEILLRLLDETGPWSTDGSSVFDEDGPQPYWAFAWGSGQALARYLIDQPELVVGKRVFDFGSGSGIVAIAAARCGAASVLASEIDPHALQAIALNAELNQVEIATTLAATDLSALDQIDVLLAADTFFHWPGNEALLLGDHTLERVLIANPPRRDYARGREIPRRRLTKLASYPVKAYPELEPDFVNTAEVYALQSEPAAR